MQAPSNSRRPISRRLTASLAVVLAVSLAGCGVFGGKDKPKTPTLGNRIPILSRDQLTIVNSKLVLNLKLNTLACGTNTPCGDGKYELAAFSAASYWDDATPQVALATGKITNVAAWKAEAKLVGAAPLPTKDVATFYVGERVQRHA